MTTILSITKQIADHEAKISALRLKLAQLQAKVHGQSAPISAFVIFWKSALPIARNRSSKHLCRKALNLIPKAERPTMEEMISAIKIWNRCAEWKKDGNQFVPALDRWIRERRWEDLPEVAEAGSRYRNAPVSLPKSDPADAVNDPAEVAKLLSLKPTRMNS
jgi:hypothetical protein